MISESFFWKESLLESVQRFNEYRSYSEIDVETYVKIEKDIFLAFIQLEK